MRQMCWNRLVFAVLLVIVPAFGMTSCSKTKKADCPEKVKEIVAINFANEMMRGGYKPVAGDELKKWMDEKRSMLIVDTMPLEASYKKQHIPGAVQIEFPIPEMKDIDENTKAEFIKIIGPDKDRLLVFYCGFTECTRSHNAAMWAVNLGYKNVYRNPGGIGGWAQAGYPVEKGQ